MAEVAALSPRIAFVLGDAAVYRYDDGTRRFGSVAALWPTGWVPRCAVAPGGGPRVQFDRSTRRAGAAPGRPALTQNLPCICANSSLFLEAEFPVPARSGGRAPASVRLRFAPARRRRPLGAACGACPLRPGKLLASAGYLCYICSPLGNAPMTFLALARRPGAPRRAPSSVRNYYNYSNLLKRLETVTRRPCKKLASTHGGAASLGAGAIRSNRQLTF